MKICIKHNSMIRTIFTKNTLFVHWSVDGDIEAAIYLKIIQHMSQQPALRPNETFLSVSCSQKPERQRFYLTERKPETVCNSDRKLVPKMSSYAASLNVF